jgi:hypothetical protein
MSDTPETDAATHDLSDYGPLVPCSWGDWVSADFARKLERERDEARKQVENQKVRIGEFFSALEKLTSERDKLKQLLAADSENVDAYLGVCIERDEAREALDCLLAVIGLTPIAGNKKALQEVVDQCLVVLRKQ